MGKYEELVEKKRVLENKLVKTETTIQLKEKEYKSLVSKMKEAGVDLKNVKKWIETQEETLTKKADEFNTILEDLDKKFKELEDARSSE